MPPPRDPEFAARVRGNFARQRMMETIGAQLIRVEPGAVDISLPYRAEFTQQHGYMHAGVVATILDSACGYAAYSLMPADAEVLTVEFKINLLRPAKGERLIAKGRVVRSGKTLTVCTGKALAQSADGETAVATMMATIMAIADRQDRKN
jgi:uncharacterized protein (TIGR00369 family)